MVWIQSESKSVEVLKYHLSGCEEEEEGLFLEHLGPWAKPKTFCSSLLVWLRVSHLAALLGPCSSTGALVSNIWVCGRCKVTSVGKPTSGIQPFPFWFHLLRSAAAGKAAKCSLGFFLWKIGVTKGGTSFRNGVGIHWISPKICSSTDLAGAALKSFGMQWLSLVLTKWAKTYQSSSLNTSKHSGTNQNYSECSKTIFSSSASDLHGTAGRDKRELAVCTTAANFNVEHPLVFLLGQFYILNATEELWNWVKWSRYCSSQKKSQFQKNKPLMFEIWKPF